METQQLFCSIEGEYYKLRILEEEARSLALDDMPSLLDKPNTVNFRPVMIGEK